MPKSAPVGGTFSGSGREGAKPSAHSTEASGRERAGTGTLSFNLDSLSQEIQASNSAPVAASTKPQYAFQTTAQRPERTRAPTTTKFGADRAAARRGTNLTESAGEPSATAWPSACRQSKR